MLIMDGMNTSSASTTAATNNSKLSTANEDFLNQKINFIQNHIEHLLHEITNLPAPWTYGVDIDGRIFFIKYINSFFLSEFLKFFCFF